MFERLITIERNTTNRAFIRINNRANHGATIVRNTKVSNSTVVFRTERDRRYYTYAAFLHHESGRDCDERCEKKKMMFEVEVDIFHGDDRKKSLVLLVEK